MSLDFMDISLELKSKGAEIAPRFIVKETKDLMIRGGDFYAIWDEKNSTWCTNEFRAIQLIDNEVKKFVEENKSTIPPSTQVKYVWDGNSGVVERWHRYCQKFMPDNYKPLDETLIFQNSEKTRDKYSSHSLPYPLSEGSHDAWDELVGTLYDPEERQKIEYAIGSIITGASKTIQKFYVFYGAPGTGKSTIMDIIDQMFTGYTATFGAKELGMSNAQFSLEPFRLNPLVAIQQDGDLSRIEDNTRLNSLISHEKLNMNEKHKSIYEMRFNCTLFMGTNTEVKISSTKSGIKRRLIDICPSNNTIPYRRYTTLLKQIPFELGAIAWHCKEVFESDPDRYNNYIPLKMIAKSNDFYAYIMENYDLFKEQDYTTGRQAWELYKQYTEAAGISKRMSLREVRNELEGYFKNYEVRGKIPDGSGAIANHLYTVFSVPLQPAPSVIETNSPSVEDDMLVLDCRESLLDALLANQPAQYGVGESLKPGTPWDNVTTKLKDLDTTKLHYVMPIPGFENLVTIDFDYKNEEGEKDRERNLKEAAKWPKTYAEFSKSGAGVHLYYIYDGDVKKLERRINDSVEVKVPVGKFSIRRRLTLCNGLPIATINSGLPQKQKGAYKDMVDYEVLKNERSIRAFINKCLRKEHHGATKPEVDFILHELDRCYAAGISYDVSDMRPRIQNFAINSTHQSETCLKLVNKMKFISEDRINQERESEKPGAIGEKPIAIYDVEVFPNLFVICWKLLGKDKPVIRMINPSAAEVENFIMNYLLVGFNNRDYDNHIMYGAMMGYSNIQLFNLSQKIINTPRGSNSSARFVEAYRLSYADIYSYYNKKDKGLKKWEIELGIHHKELNLPWDQPVPEELWEEVAAYCDNDVIATEAVWNATQNEFIAHQILADIAGMTPNETTNKLTTKIIFGNNKNPQNAFNYRFLGDPADWTWEDAMDYALGKRKDKPKGKPWWPGYVFQNNVSTYRGETVGEGGYVYFEPGMWYNVDCEDSSGHHPHSIYAENLFGTEYTERYFDLVRTRGYIKHGEFDKAGKSFDGKLAKYLGNVTEAKKLSGALKIAQNAVYGLTDAKFDNPFRDKRNMDNIVAKRGALFMIDLKYCLQELGYTVIHCKTDSVKIANCDQKAVDFIRKFGDCYGYVMETESIYEKLCLVNKAVYIAKYAQTHPDEDERGKWTATGTQFAVPYVFKTLFSKEPIEFSDMCETRSVSSGTHIALDMNENLPDVSLYDTELKSRSSNAKDVKHIRELEDWTDEELKAESAKGHNYHFVGRVGLFCPIKDGYGGGLMVRIKDGKADAVTGTKGYRWLEAEDVRDKGLEDAIDRSYYDDLVDKAARAIAAHGDYHIFCDDAPQTDFMTIPDDVTDDTMPF